MYSHGDGCSMPLDVSKRKCHVGVEFHVIRRGLCGSRLMDEELHYVPYIHAARFLYSPSGLSFHFGARKSLQVCNIMIDMQTAKFGC